MIYQYQQETSKVRSDGKSRAAHAEKEIDRTLNIVSSRLSNTNEQLTQTKKSMEPSRSDPWYFPWITRVHADKINRGTRKIGSLETVCFEHCKRYDLYVRKSLSTRKKFVYVRKSRTAFAKDKPYMHAKSAQRAQKPCTTNTKDVYVRKICTQTYAKSVKHTISRISLRKQSADVSSKARRRVKRHVNPRKRKVVMKRLWLDERKKSNQ